MFGHKVLKLSFDEKRGYEIHIGSGLLRSDLLTFYLSEKLRSRSAVVVSDPVVAESYYPLIRENTEGIDLKLITIPEGENSKSLECLGCIFDRLMDFRADRRTPLLALGGGVIGDITGFAASTWQRGCPFVQIPTTLLAQVDSSVGGKTGINHPKAKNMIGAFYQPEAVLIDIDTLGTLPDIEFSSGMAEVIKYALIRDKGLLDFIECNTESIVLKSAEIISEMIYRCCRIKADVVQKDEKESGLRAILNFGHTFGHAIENAFGYGTYRHGQAVAIGMVLASKVSDLAEKDVRRVVDVLESFGLPVEIPRLDFGTWMELMMRDKKASEGRVAFVLLESIGKATVGNELSDRTLRKLLEW